MNGHNYLLSRYLAGVAKRVKHINLGGNSVFNEWLVEKIMFE